VPFIAGQFSLSHIAASASDEAADAEGVDAIDVFRAYGGTDFVKIDIEGGEWALLHDPRLRNLAAVALVLEYHPHLAPAEDTAAAAASVLAAAGFESERIFHRRDGVGMLWAWRTDASES
jgi:hypothetical protein